MLLPDLINGLFEGFGAVFMLLNVRQAYRDQAVRGVHGHAVAFFCAWQLFQLFYYSHLDQWISLVGCIALVIVQLTWTAQFVYYRSKQL